MRAKPEKPVREEITDHIYVYLYQSFDEITDIIRKACKEYDKKPGDFYLRLEKDYDSQLIYFAFQRMMTEEEYERNLTVYERNLADYNKWVSEHQDAIKEHAEKERDRDVRLIKALAEKHKISVTL